MMMVETKTRTQRRMERKQALILLVLVLVVSLSSFTLGVIVGRRGAERDLAQNQPETRRIMVAEVATPQAATEAQPKVEAKPAEEEKLTFYDNLSRGETIPLGSGINLPPKKEEPVAPKPQEKKAPAVETKVVETVKSSPEATTPKVAAAPTVVPKSLPPTDRNGTFSVQVGSFSSVSDAGRLKKSLVTKGYSAFIAEADLGSKGIWYRVRLGPYSDADMAKRAMLIADKKDNIKGFVSRL